MRSGHMKSQNVQSVHRTARRGAISFLKNRLNCLSNLSVPLQALLVSRGLFQTPSRKIRQARWTRLPENPDVTRKPGSSTLPMATGLQIKFVRCEVRSAHSLIWTSLDPLESQCQLNSPIPQKLTMTALRTSSLLRWIVARCPGSMSWVDRSVFAVQDRKTDTCAGKP